MTIQNNNASENQSLSPPKTQAVDNQDNGVREVSLLNDKQPTKDCQLMGCDESLSVPKMTCADQQPHTQSVGTEEPFASATLRLPWSQGQTEGQVNRLKLIKRQMYGRANFDLLRKRVIGSPMPG